MMKLHLTVNDTSANSHIGTLELTQSEYTDENYTKLDSIFLELLQSHFAGEKFTIADPIRWTEALGTLQEDGVEAFVNDDDEHLLGSIWITKTWLHSTKEET